MTLQEEYFQAKGMVHEVIMKCRLAESQLVSDNIDEESLFRIVNSVEQLRKDFDRYSKELDRIERKMEIEANEDCEFSSMGEEEK